MSTFIRDRKTRLAIIIVAVLLLFSAIFYVTCFKGKTTNVEKKRVTIYIDWVPSGEYYGIFYAKEHHFYDSLGYDVDIVNGNGAPGTASLVANGTALFGTTTSDNVLRQLILGKNFYKAVPLIKFNPTVLISLDSTPIKSIKQVVGKQIGVNVQSSTYNHFLWALDNAKIDLNSISEYPIGYGGINELIEKKVAAFLGYTTNHSVDLEMRGVLISELYLGDLGVKSYGTVLVTADESTLKKHGLSINDADAIMQATLRGYMEGGNNPSDAASILVSQEKSLNVTKLIRVIEKIRYLNEHNAISIYDIDNWVSGADSKQRENNRQLYK